MMVTRETTTKPGQPEFEDWILWHIHHAQEHRLVHRVEELYSQKEAISNPIENRKPSRSIT